MENNDGNVTLRDFNLPDQELQREIARDELQDLNNQDRLIISNIRAGTGLLLLGS